MNRKNHNCCKQSDLESPLPATRSQLRVEMKQRESAGGLARNGLLKAGIRVTNQKNETLILRRCVNQNINVLHPAGVIDTSHVAAINMYSEAINSRFRGPPSAASKTDHDRSAAEDARENEVSGLKRKTTTRNRGGFVKHEEEGLKPGSQLSTDRPGRHGG
ncbi:hypothetical protein L596_011590 [Steinernema carpocapsae]|uniref:Uncharacterized protein n=1 Tax=Steinernema carpocapsae TaxID=34508 RepID=A0A4U5NUE3_STECR|nr:hypothetical protein L596_011590 [Steinernema carpocapsae]